MSTFASLDLVEPVQRALQEAGYETPTPIQAQAIPPLLAGRDVLGCAQTGTGKTAAFLLPVLDRIERDPVAGKPYPRTLVLTPTRELAAQIGESFDTYAKHLDLHALVIFGGVKQGPQVRELRRGVDVVIATPGRLLDLHGQGEVDLSDVEFFVLDEADRMLDMGFIHDIRKVLAVLPKKRQNLLFSATMPEPIVKLASGFLNDPVRVEVDPQSTTVERIDQSVMFCQKADKKRLLVSLLRDPSIESAIVFTRTKHGANRVVKDLEKGGIGAAAIHGNKSQNARTRAINGFRSGDLRVLVATDIASRGIDIDGVSHVFNYDLPNISESYVHRIGRTGRAGRDGIAIAFCEESEVEYLYDIEKLTQQAIPVVTEHDWHAPEIAEQYEVFRERRKSGRGGGRPGGGGGGGGGGGRRGPGGGGGRSGRGGGRRGGGGPRSNSSGQAGQRPEDGAGRGDRPRRRRRRRGGGGNTGGGSSTGA